MKKNRFLTILVLVIFLFSAFSTLYSFAAQTHGDLNFDGSVNSTDFGLFRQYLLGIYYVNDKNIATNEETFI